MCAFGQPTTGHEPNPHISNAAVEPANRTWAAKFAEAKEALACAFGRWNWPVAGEWLPDTSPNILSLARVLFESLEEGACQTKDAHKREPLPQLSEGLLDPLQRAVLWEFVAVSSPPGKDLLDVWE